MNIGWEGVGSQDWEAFLIKEARVIFPKPQIALWLGGCPYL